MICDALVIGGGLAGLYGVLHLPKEWDVVVVDKGAQAGSSPLAQGGMAVPVGPDDSPALHASDTVRAGAGACVPEAVDVLTSLAISALDELVALGCGFDRAPDGSFDLNREGGQTVARSVHWADATGRELMRVVLEHARERARRVIGSAVRLVVDDGRCVGAVVLTADGPVTIVARGVLLASGGCGALYEATTNQPASTGDAVTLAHEAGADVADLEFVQFHPTALARGGHQRVLLTEALRGHGATVVDGDGRRFLFDHHADGELAPRDVVARAIAQRGEAYLDARSVADLRRRFPNVYAAVLDAGFDMEKQAVPVAPAAHYFLGGVRTDVEGRTSLPGLYAAGECAATGVHGANRMAGNSLTEACVFGRLAALAFVHEGAPRPQETGVAVAHGGDDGRPDSADAWRAMRRAMTSGAGLVRSADSLRAASGELAEIASRASSQDLRMAAVAAGLICASALERAESRGVHHRSDAPGPGPEWEGRHVVLQAGTGPVVANL